MGGVFKKILIANRGEIAIRIIRAARELGIKTVAVYSEADRNAIHVRLADEAYEIGPPEPLKSYLNMDVIIETALRSGAEAIHPGYGFLAENHIFVEKVEKAGLVFIGPNPKAMMLMGGKLEARATARKIGSPIVPGTLDPVSSVEEARKVAEEIGYPILLKPSGGGGGIGMKVVRSEEELERAFEISRSEALAAFGNPEVYIEKYLERPRHIEFQIAADNYGNAVYFYERECSIQRRHQKLVEESPSTALNDEIRREMGETAVRIVQEAGYNNLGTVEFLYKDGKYYFLEMNTRLQVEHGVTELVTGIDLVKLQIRIAAGEELPMSQRDIKAHGWAFEARINAEDVLNNFTPNPGKIRLYREPAGPGVRVDSGVYEGYEVPGYYDPLIAKLMVWGVTRDEAVARMRRALREYRIVGIETSIPLHRRIFSDPDFQAGRIDTSYLKDKLPSFIEDILRERAVKLALAAAGYKMLSIKAPSEKVETRKVRAGMSEWKRYGLYRLMGWVK